MGQKTFVIIILYLNVEIVNTIFLYLKIFGGSYVRRYGILCKGRRVLQAERD